jgi:hypothetical protein
LFDLRLELTDQLLRLPYFFDELIHLLKKLFSVLLELLAHHRDHLLACLLLVLKACKFGL